MTSDVGKAMDHPTVANRTIVDDPEQENHSLSKKKSMIAGFVIFLAHCWFLKYLEDEYIERYYNNIHLYIVRDYVGLWIPIFLGSIAAESLFYRFFWKKNAVYRWNDSLGSMTLGGYNFFTNKLLGQVLILHGPYFYVWRTYGQYIYQHFPILQNHLVAWWFMLLGVEFSYYWVHRTGHTVNALWAMHGVHHSSEEYNLSTALRQSSIHRLFSWAYYVPFAFFFPPSLYLIHDQFNLLYQYWIHTQVIGKLGFLEYILNTPSQHRVHHGRNQYCIDKNYGGTLCIFDRLFGTFQEEIDEIPVVYGVTHSINTFEPLKANIIPWKGILAKMREAKGFSNKVKCLLNGPGWIPNSNPPAEYTIPPCTRATVTKYHTYSTWIWKLYSGLVFLIATAGVQLAILGLKDASTICYWYSIISLLFFCFSLYCVGIACDCDSRTIPIHLIHTLFGSLYFAYGVLYLQESFAEWRDTELLIISIVSVASIFFLVWRRHDFVDNKSLVQLGADSHDAALAQQLQLELYANRSKKKID